MIQATEQHTDDVPKKTGSGRHGKFFSIPIPVVDALIAARATAGQICACLVIARHTDRSGRFSSAGLKAMRTKLGMGHSLAKQVVDGLLKIRAKVKGVPVTKSNILYRADRWQKVMNEPVPEASTKRAEIGFVLNDFGTGSDDRLWLPNTLVDGYGQFSRPLRRLRGCGDVAARALLLMYKQHDMESYGGVNPHCTVYQEYQSSAVCSTGNCDFHHCAVKHQFVWDAFSAPALGVQALAKDREQKNKQLKPLWDALAALEQGGFIYEVITVFSDAIGNVEAEAEYVIHTRNRHGHAPKGEEGVGGKIARIMGRLGSTVTDAEGRFYGSYGAVVRRGAPAHVAGVYRLRFRVTDPSVPRVCEAWQAVAERQAKAQHKLDKIEAILRERERAESYRMANALTGAG